MLTREIQREALVLDDLSPYRGSWVALRNRRVVANALDAEELRDRDDVREDDDLVLVPTQVGGTFLL